MSNTDKPAPRSPNDQRSDIKNPNNADHKQNRDNRANQLNPNHGKPAAAPAPKPLKK